VSVGIDGALVKLGAEVATILQMGFFWVLSYVCGAILALRTAYKLKLHSDNPNHHPLSSAVVSFFITAALVALPSAMDSVRESLGFSSTASSPLGYVSAGSGMSAMEGAIYAYAAFFGYIAFIRGLMILNKGAEPSKRGDELGRGITHLVGAILATNLSEFVGWLKEWFM
jgi:hypothetical protein